ncbi:uncharacterized protein [Euwallacea fornicatus]|uniref:uncharacterized protein isoform X2 n=1 Tax=Euwallacea fornicatus TaxID=995702 RepID=UPI00338F6D3D
MPTTDIPISFESACLPKGSAMCKGKPLLFLIFLTVPTSLCTAYSIKQPGTYTTSFSKSSSSASAFSQSSSSSYTIDGNIAPADVESLKEALKSGAVAHASAGAAGHANAGAAAGSVAGAVAGATASAGVLASANAGYIADGNDHIIVDGSSHEQGAATNAPSNVKGGGCSGGTSCGNDKDFNSISDSSSVANGGSYKVIGSDKYATGYSTGDNTNYVVSGQYVQPIPNAILGGCISCKGPFPGPTGNIHTFKPAVSNPHSAPAPAVQPIVSTSGPLSHQHGSAIINNLPGPSGSIYQSKPAAGYSGQSTTEAQTQYNFGSAHVSPGLVATLPGPSGSIYDSKPASAVASAGAHADAAIAPSHPQVVPAHPQVVQPSAAPSCFDSNCGSKPSLSDIISVLPGSLGSIHESKPASGVISTSHQTSGSSSGSHSSSGSISLVPPTPVVGPSCSYAPVSGSTDCGGNSASEANSGFITNTRPIFPGPSGSIHSYKPVVSGNSASSSGNQIGVASAESSSSSSSNAYSGAGSATYNPYTHPTSDTSKHTSGSTVISNTPSETYTGDCTSCKGPFPGPNGSIHKFKPVSSVVPHGVTQISTNTVESSSSTSSLSSSTSSEFQVYNGAGSVTNIPASHPVVGPVCNYSPGSPNKCVSSESSTSHAEAGASDTSEYEAGSAVLTPSIHPQLPSPGTYYVNKPTSNIEPPHVNQAHTFAGQIPCDDSKCGNIQKEVSQAHPGNCGSAGGCGGAVAASQGSAASGIIYETKEANTQYSSTNHDAAHVSGGVVFQNEDGSYSNLPKGTRPIYKNSDKGGYAISSNAADNTGVLIGPGTGHLPIEADRKPFGTQGAFGGSDALNKKINTDKLNSFSSSSAIAHSSEHTTTSNTGLGTDVTIQKVDGTVVTPVDTTFNQSPCVIDGSCGNVGNSEIKTGIGYTNVVTDAGTGYISAPSSASSIGNEYHTVGILTSGPGTETGNVNIGTSVTSGLETGIGYNDVPTSTSGTTTGIGYNNAGTSPIAGSHSVAGNTKATSSSTGSGSINTVSANDNGSSTSSGSVTGTDYNAGAISSSGSLAGTSYTNVATPGFNGYDNVPDSPSGSNIGLNTEQIEYGHKQQSGTPIKLNCQGPFCDPGSTQVYIIEEKPQHGHRHHGIDSGYATGQVFINQGQNVLDITNSGSHGFGSNYAGSHGGSYFPPIRGYSSGCGSGKCGAFGGYGGSYHKPASSYSTVAGEGYGIPTSGGFLEGLFGKGGLSGNIFNAGGSQAAAYSSSGAYGGASAGSYASATAGASASAGAYAGSY